METIVSTLNEIIWSPLLVLLILGMGLYLTIRSGFLQFRHLKEMVTYTFQEDSSKRGISSFQAVSMSIGSRAGIGNIAGVATAITTGGPGALFWMWVMALLSSATSFVEVSLAQAYKRQIAGQLRGGTPFYIGDGLGWKKYASVFSVITILSMSLLVPAIQVNTIGSAMDSAFGIKPIVTAILLVILMSLVIFGGVKRLAKTAQFLVPFMSIAYLVMAVIIMVANADKLPATFALIFSSAFGSQAAFGGIAGSAIAWGVQRGAYSNAAGFGSETFEGGAAEVSHPAKQGFVQAFSVFIDTIVLCSLTGLMILVTGAYNVIGPEGQVIRDAIGAVEAGSGNTQLAINTVLPTLGSPFVAIAIFLFAITSLFTYSYKAETSLTYLTRNMKEPPQWPMLLIKVAMIIGIFFATIRESSLAWGLGDLGFGLMTWLNLLSLFFLTKPAMKILKDYRDQARRGLDPVFDPEASQVPAGDFWRKNYDEEDLTKAA